MPNSPKPVLDIMDTYGQGRVDASDTKGLFWILDEESMFPGATDITFLERVLMHHSDSGNYAVFNAVTYHQYLNVFLVSTLP